jgi:hypothetical protein
MAGLLTLFDQASVSTVHPNSGIWTPTEVAFYVGYAPMRYTHWTDGGVYAIAYSPSRIQLNLVASFVLMRPIVGDVLVIPECELPAGTFDGVKPPLCDWKSSIDQAEPLIDLPVKLEAAIDKLVARRDPQTVTQAWNASVFFSHLYGDPFHPRALHWRRRWQASLTETDESQSFDFSY